MLPKVQKNYSSNSVTDISRKGTEISITFTLLICLFTHSFNMFFEYLLCSIDRTTMGQRT